MSYVVAGIVLVGAVCLLNLLLTFGVIRRLREHEKQLAGRDGPALDGMILPVGQTPADFTVTTTEGAPVDRADLAGEVLVGFFSTGCEPCRDTAPDFARYAGDFPGDRDHALVVIVGEDEEVAAWFEALFSDSARVVRDPTGAGPISTAFAVTGYPAFALLADDGTVAASGLGLGSLPELPAHTVPRQVTPASRPTASAGVTG